MKPLTVKELIATLKEQDLNAYVTLSNDSEGNNFSLMANELYITNAYLQKELGSQEQYFKDDEIKKDGDAVTDYYGNKIAKKKLAKCVILWPGN